MFQCCETPTDSGGRLASLKATQLESSSATGIVGRWDRGRISLLGWREGRDQAPLSPPQSEGDGDCFRGAGLPIEGLATWPSDQEGTARGQWHRQALRQQWACGHFLRPCRSRTKLPRTAAICPSLPPAVAPQCLALTTARQRWHLGAPEPARRPDSCSHS